MVPFALAEVNDIPQADLLPGLVLRLLIATAAGTVLGYPFRHRPGGVRTHVLVSVGSALFCTTAFRYASAQGGGDVLRMLQGIASGIGFVGAASVLKHEEYVGGITTAASIWVAAAVGSEAALGSTLVVGVISPIIAAASMILGVVERSIFEKRKKMKFGEQQREIDKDDEKKKKDSDDD